jgi:hypothetical protein
MTDREDRLTDLRMPEVGTDGHAALLIAEHLASAPPGAADVAFDQLEALVAGWAREYKPYWRASAREPGAAGGLVREAVAKLEALGLVRLAGGVVRARPAFRRFRFDGPRRPAPTRPVPAAPDASAAALFDLPGAAPARPDLSPEPRPEPGLNSNSEPKAAA